MKHIKKKHLVQIENIPMLPKTSIFTEHSLKEIKSKSKTDNLFIITDNGYMFKAFSYNNNGQTALIPIPDLTLVYLDSSYNFNKLRKQQEKLMFDKVTVKDNNYGEDAINEIYKFYGYSSSCIILLFTALESFINHMIPDNEVYTKVLNNKTEVYSKEQIQNHIQFKEKVTEVLPFFYKKSFFNKQTSNKQHIDNLKEIRDQIVHTKSDSNSLSQEELIKKVIKFKFDETFQAIANFMNFYKKDFVVECNCSEDY